MSDGKFKKGNKSGGSRKGIPNKLTTDLRELFLSVAHELHPDGAKAALQKWAENPRNQGKYWEMISRMLPRSVNLSIEEHALKLAEQIKEKDPKLYEKVVKIMNEMED